VIHKFKLMYWPVDHVQFIIFITFTSAELCLDRMSVVATKTQRLFLNYNTADMEEPECLIKKNMMTIDVIWIAQLIFVI
jgi:hypothetical protein